MLVNEEENEDAHVFIFDQRTSKTSCKKLSIGGIFSFLEFFNKLIREFPYRKGESFVITTTNRLVITDDDAFLSMIESGDTLYILRNVDQPLEASVYEKIDFQPHYDTLIKSGVYEYYASEGSINPLPFAFAELIDNALGATAKNTFKRQIALKIYFNDEQEQYVMSIQDNGIGMSPRQLNNWAVYRLSKFNRRDRHKAEPEIIDVDAPSMEESGSKFSKSLNSDISWFGVGGKQAIFFIGGAVRVITRSRGECDVHEFVLSKDDFKQKEVKREKIYSGYIKNRPQGDSSHVPHNDKITKMIINNEDEIEDRQGFTNIVVSNVDPQHVSYIRNGFDIWTRQLAHIYHYYIHGNEGNTAMSKQRKNIGAMDVNITVELHENGKRKHFIALDDIEDDQETLFIRTACDTFEFEINSSEENSKIEGIMRYHPFLYDKETYPIVDNTVSKYQQEEDEDDSDEGLPDDSCMQTRGSKAIYQCFWNGRLIPYTYVQDFEWCKTPRKRGALPTECYERVSGCLFTNDYYKVSTNKLTFIDLDTKLKDPSITFNRVILGEPQFGSVQRQFLDWLKECHEKYDKQIKFLNFLDHVLHTSRQTKMLWTSYEAINWEGKLFKSGQLIRTCKTSPVMFGKIQRFLLLGQHDGDTFAVGGEVEIIREPLEIYGDSITFSLTKLDRSTSETAVTNLIRNESSNVPARIAVHWPNNNGIKNGDTLPFGSNVSDMKVRIVSNKGETVDKLITNSGPRKLLVEQKVYFLSAKTSSKRTSKSREISSHVSSYPYSFKAIENIQNMGEYLIDLQVLFASTGSSVLGDGKELPSLSIGFSITEAPPYKFMVGVLESPLCIGVPFNIPLDLQDKQNNPAKAIDCGEPIINSSGLELSYDDYDVKENNIVITNVVAVGKVSSQSGQNFSMTVTLPRLKLKTQTLKVRLLPGTATALQIQGVTCDESEVDSKEDGSFSIANRSKLSIEVAVTDRAGNISSITSKTKFQAKFSGNLNIPVFTSDKKANNTIVTLSGKLNIKKLKEDTSVTAKISVLGHKAVEPLDVNFIIKSSTEPHTIIVYYQDPLSEEENIQLKTGQEIYWHAGEVISNLSFELYDEANRLVPITDNVAENLKLNWVGDEELEQFNFSQGELPDVTVPLNTNDSKFCQIVYNGTTKKTAQFSFFVKPVAGEPQSLKCDILGDREIQLGVIRNDMIKVSICDKHHNILNFRENQVQFVTIHAEGLDGNLVTKQFLKNHVILSNIEFNQGPLGSKELTIEYNSNDVHLKEHVLIHLTAGTPVLMEVLDWPSFEQAMVVASGTKILENISVQILDGWGNPTKQKGVRVMMSKDTGIKLSPSLGPLLTNEDGCVKFSKFAVTAKKGEYWLQPRAVFNRTAIEGPKLLFSVLPNTETPVAVKVQYDVYVNRITVNSPWPEFKVKVLTEEGECVTSEIHLAMSIWKASGKKEKVPSNAEIHRQHLTEPDIAVFSDISAPKVPATYCINFRVMDGPNSHSTVISSQIYKFGVHADVPHKLTHSVNPGIPTVSNAKNAANRTLIKHLKLRLVDQFGNHCVNQYNGTVRLTIEPAQESLKSNSIPLFEGRCKTLNVTMKNGFVALNNICLQENSPGIDASEYILKCDVICANLEESIPSYTLAFMFYNDANKQQQMAALSKQSDALKKDIDSYESLFAMHETLLDEMRKEEENLKIRRSNIFSELKECKLSVSDVSTNEIDEMVSEIKKKQERLSLNPRRTCKLKEYPGKSADIVGKVGHLALVEDEDIAKVLSWHLYSDMDCLITKTTEKAREVYKCTSGMQQVLPFDSIFKKNLEDERPLPHNRIKKLKVRGNPMFARDALIFPKHSKTCKVVFRMLIGDTIIIDDLASANDYRKEVVKHTFCPTILTRNGERVKSNGKFGGGQNKILSIDQLKGIVFGAPLGTQHQNYVTQQSLLEELKTVSEELDETLHEITNQEEETRTPEMLKKRKEHQDALLKLKEIEEKLGMSTSHTPEKLKQKHSLNDLSKDESNIPKKKARHR